MSHLSVYADISPELPNKVLTHPSDIAATLADVGVRYVRWPLTPGALATTTDEQLLAYCQPQIEQLMAEQGYGAQQLLSLSPEQLQGADANWLQEQRCAGAELRFVVRGTVQVNLHLAGYVFSLLCESGDLLGLPAGCLQWLDCTAPALALRLARDDAGLAMQPSGDAIASQFARLEDFYSAGG